MPAEAALPRYRSKTVTAWLALTLGSLGAHRVYLHGWSDRWFWCFPLPTLLGLGGLIRLRNLGQDDTVGALLVPLLGIMLTIALVTAIVYALTPDERWNERHNSGRSGRPAGWAAVFAAIIGLFCGTVALISTIAYGGQRLFEMERNANLAATVPPAASAASPSR